MQSIATKKLSVLETSGLGVNRIINQCYDGACVISGVRDGVQELIQRLNKVIPYIHCFKHQLHLVVVRALEHERRQFIELAAALYNFTRPVIANIYEGDNLKCLLDQRWTGHYETVNVIIGSHAALVDVLDEATHSPTLPGGVNAQLA